MCKVGGSGSTHAKKNLYVLRSIHISVEILIYGGKELVSFLDNISRSLTLAHVSVHEMINHQFRLTHRKSVRVDISVVVIMFVSTLWLCLLNMGQLETWEQKKEREGMPEAEVNHHAHCNCPTTVWLPETKL